MSRPCAPSWLVRHVLRLVAALALAVSQAAGAQGFPVRLHDQSDGLTSLSVAAIAQDLTGFLWVGTSNGLFRFDGQRFARWAPVQIRQVVDLHLGPDGALWVGTATGLFRILDGKTSVVAPTSRALNFDILDNIVSQPSGGQLVVSQDALWNLSQTPSGEWHASAYFDAAQIASHRDLVNVSRLRVARDGSLWLSCRRALCHWHDGRLDVLDGPPAGAGGWNGLFEDRDGNLWVRDSTRILVLPRGGKSLIDRTPMGELHSSSLFVTAFAQDAAGRILTPAGRGLVRWDGRAWTRFDQASGLVSSFGVTTLFVDRDGAVWLGTDGNGLVQWLGYDHLSSWGSRSGLVSDDAWSFLRDRQGQLHVGTTGGIAALDLDRRRAVAEIRSEGFSSASSLVQDAEGKLWASSYSGQLFTRPAGSHRWRLFARLPLVFQLLADSSGRIWVSTQNGLFSITNVHGRPPVLTRMDIATNPDPAIGPRTFGGCESASHALWFTTDRGGLLRWENGRLTAVPIAAADGTPTTWPGFDVIACERHGEDVWLSGMGHPELHKLHWAQGAGRLEALNLPILGQRMIESVHEDRRGWLWLATDGGVLVSTADGWRYYDQANGLVWNDINQGALYEDTDGSMWIGTDHGAEHIEHLDDGVPRTRQDVTVLSLQRAGKPIDWRSGAQLAWPAAPLRIELASLAYEDRPTQRFRYRLAGLEEEWSVTSSPEVTFSALEPGSYRFEVMAQNAVTGALSAAVSVSLRITPPWWRTPGFYAACITATFLLAWYLHRWRLRISANRQAELERIVNQRTCELERSRAAIRLLSSHNARALEHERTRVSRELHDEMGQQLAALRIEVSLMRRTFASKPSEGLSPFDNLLGRVDSLIRSIRGLVSQLRPPALDGGLDAAIDWLATEFEKQTGIECQREIVDCKAFQHADAATMAFRIIQESLTNVRRHAAAAVVRIRVQSHGTEGCLEVSDDGVGFDPDSPCTGYGLLGMEERVTSLGGTLEIDSSPGRGTTVRVKVDMRSDTQATLAGPSQYPSPAAA
jgi:signal transduction histidine kinase/ligand-binding sensor domain-containing protein